MEDTINSLLSRAGIEPNGKDPWDIRIRDQRFYDHIVKDPHFELGETYMNGWWECDRVDEFIARLLAVDMDSQVKYSPKTFFKILLHRIFNFQNKWRSQEVAKKHYDIGNDLYQAMLDPTMNYSCGYWKTASSLEEAQRDKMELICRKLMLKPGLTLLDIGCGWGSFAKYAAEHYGVSVVGLTISQRQKEFAEKNCRGMPVEICLQDYRDYPLKEFDRIVSIGMFEHVGYKNYPEFMQVAQRHLKDEGLFLLHTIGSNLSYHFGDPWIDTYIFPNGMLPSIVQIATAIEGLFVMEDWHNFGAYYDKTLMAWHHNFNAHWNELKSHYDERFKRMWNYYLLSCAGSFRSRKNQLWQIVLSKRGIPGGYQRVT